MDNFVEIVELDGYPNRPDRADDHDIGPATGLLADGKAIYRLAVDAKTRVRNLRLRSALWDCLLKVNGRRDAATIATELQRPLAEVLHDLDRLSLLGIIHEPDAISLQQHLYPNAGPAARPEQKPAMPSTTSPEPNPAPTPIATPSPETRADTRSADCHMPSRRSLQCLLRLIRDRHGSGRHTELAVYRIFTAIPRRMFADAGISSFLFIDETTEITDAELMRALIDETRKQLRLDVCPEMQRCLAA
ncbi:MAG: hypothetical protein H6926_05295 [Chromatiales bacterium]|nr:hypothetical protein [Chromatiales bacterium]